MGLHHLTAQGPPSIRGLPHLTAQGLHQLGAPTTSLHSGLHQLGATTTSLHRGLHLCKSGPGCTTIHLIYRWNNGNIFWVAMYILGRGPGERRKGEGEAAMWGPQ